MTKDQLRIIYKEKRASLTAVEINKLEDLILIRFQAVTWEIPDKILSYRGSNKLNEYDPSLVERFCRFRNPFATIAYPVITAGDIFHAIPANDDTVFLLNKYGIEEPSEGKLMDNWELDMIFVPLIAFDPNGFRVGYGKGYYDRFLRTCREDVLKIGFSFFEVADSIDDLHEHDIPLDYCITPNIAYSFINK